MMIIIIMCYKIKIVRKVNKPKYFSNLGNPRAPALSRVSQVWINAGANAAAATSTSPQWP